LEKPLFGERSVRKIAIRGQFMVVEAANLCL